MTIPSHIVRSESVISFEAQDGELTTQDLYDLSARLQDPQSGIEVKERAYRLRRYPRVFVGSELVDWLMISGIVKRRPDGEEVGQLLVDCDLIYHVHGDVFKDGFFFYRFKPFRRAMQSDEIEEIISLMHSSDGGIHIETRMWSLITYRDTFIGSEAVDWIIATLPQFRARHEAVSLCQTLLDLGAIHCAWTQAYAEFTDDATYYQFEERDVAVEVCSIGTYEHVASEVHTYFEVSETNPLMDYFSVALEWREEPVYGIVCVTNENICFRAHNYDSAFSLVVNLADVVFLARNELAIRVCGPANKGTRLKVVYPGTPAAAKQHTFLAWREGALNQFINLIVDRCTNLQQHEPEGYASESDSEAYVERPRLMSVRGVGVSDTGDDDGGSSDTKGSTATPTRNRDGMVGPTSVTATTVETTGDGVKTPPRKDSAGDGGVDWVMWGEEDGGDLLTRSVTQESFSPIGTSGLGNISDTNQSGVSGQPPTQSRTFTGGAGESERASATPPNNNNNNNTNNNNNNKSESGSGSEGGQLRSRSAARVIARPRKGKGKSVADTAGSGSDGKGEKRSGKKSGTRGVHTDSPTSTTTSRNTTPTTTTTTTEHVDGHVNGHANRDGNLAYPVSRNASESNTSSSVTVSNSTASAQRKRKKGNRRKGKGGGRRKGRTNRRPAREYEATHTLVSPSRASYKLSRSINGSTTQFWSESEGSSESESDSTPLARPRQHVIGHPMRLTLPPAPVTHVLYVDAKKHIRAASQSESVPHVRPAETAKAVLDALATVEVKVISVSNMELEMMVAAMLVCTVGGEFVLAYSDSHYSPCRFVQHTFEPIPYAATVSFVRQETLTGKEQRYTLYPCEYCDVCGQINYETDDLELIAAASKHAYVKTRGLNLSENTPLLGVGSSASAAPDGIIHPQAGWWCC